MCSTTTSLLTVDKSRLIFKLFYFGYFWVMLYTLLLTLLFDPFVLFIFYISLRFLRLLKSAVDDFLLSFLINGLLFSFVSKFCFDMLFSFSWSKSWLIIDLDFSVILYGDCWNFFCNFSYFLFVMPDGLFKRATYGCWIPKLVPAVFLNARCEVFFPSLVISGVCTSFLRATSGYRYKVGFLLSCMTIYMFGMLLLFMKLCGYRPFVFGNHFYFDVTGADEC